MRSTARRSPATCWSGSRRPRPVSAPRSSRPPPGVLAAYRSDAARRSAARAELRRARGSWPLRTRCTCARRRTSRRCARHWSSGCSRRSATPPTPVTPPARPTPAGRCSSAWTRWRTSPRSTTCPRWCPRPAGRDCTSWSACRTSARSARAGATTPPKGSCRSFRPSSCCAASATAAPWRRSVSASASTTARLAHTTISASASPGWFTGPGSESTSVSYQTVRQRTLSPGEVAQIPRGRALLLSADGWGLLRLAPWYATAPWRDIVALDSVQRRRGAAAQRRAPSRCRCRTSSIDKEERHEHRCRRVHRRDRPAAAGRAIRCPGCRSTRSCSPARSSPRLRRAFVYYLPLAGSRPHRRLVAEHRGTSRARRSRFCRWAGRCSGCSSPPRAG